MASAGSELCLKRGLTFWKSGSVTGQLIGLERFRRLFKQSLVSLFVRLGVLAQPVGNGLLMEILFIRCKGNIHQ